MDAFHPQLDHGISIAELDEAVADLSTAIPNLTDDELLAGVMRIVASVSADGCDGHLGAYVWGTGSYPVDSLPLRLWLFDDGVYIVDALAPYEEFVGARILMIGDVGMDRVLTMLDPLVPRDNEQTVRLLMPRYLLIPQVLRGAGVITADGSITMKVDDGEGGEVDLVVDPIPMADYNDWAGGYGLHLPEDPEVPYLSRIGEDLWWELFGNGTLFVQYNRVEFLEPSELNQLRTAITGPDVTRVVIDVRHNFGGELSALDRPLDLFTNAQVIPPGSLYLITGRNTFSAGSLFTARLDDQTDVVIVGETGGGCPTLWGDSEPLSLSYSGIEVSVPTSLAVGVSPTDPRLVMEPDLSAPLTAADWALGIDRALTTIQEDNN